MSTYLPVITAVSHLNQVAVETRAPAKVGVPVVPLFSVTPLYKFFCNCSHLLHNPSNLLCNPNPLLHNPGKLLYNPSPLLHNPDNLLCNPSHLLHNPSNLLYHPSNLLHHLVHLHLLSQNQSQ